MATIHFILQGKGGVGKSMIAALLYQAATALGKSVEAFDTDPINATLAGYEGFTVTRIDVLDESGAIDPRKFDELMEGLAFSQCEHVIVDNGASSFVELGNYIKTGDMLKTLQEGGPPREKDQPFSVDYILFLIMSMTCTVKVNIYIIVYTFAVHDGAFLHLADFSPL